ncbi:hypothetical protein [Algoriphagus sp. CAU 1675]|uniref:hypothetical protein n=1 Tax=Algoriphagus sp. CAU 1675 TaxID=3032597 RepID=UPI0023D9809B|nr:hypothetical protein [Algoriphagus sp. CAU 1675]MDF2158855.1 hypothetical protein [Algoriphagus sp. CAU 1675]
MSKMENDELIRDFFSEMKKQDRHLEIPEFPEEKAKAKSFNWWIPIGIAASLVFGFLILGKNEPQVEPVPEVLIITLEQINGQELQFHIEETTEMDIWESPTASLLTEF